MKTWEDVKDQTVVQTKGNLISNMDGGIVMMSVQSGKYYNLGRVGGRIWSLIENPVSVRQLISTLMEEYEIGEVECREQVLKFLNNLQEEQLIHVGDEVAVNS
ncbi:lasso peptide biosynthesis PqqD family chaperone [Paenibacillus chartarius]|uniref:Lasso peptide biosynthesis PqqD family chaperone n=1 Tax=Paenibacillus chartarius TaxID=747481 RepID=A0ABV6DKN9_9BACL